MLSVLAIHGYKCQPQMSGAFACAMQGTVNTTMVVVPWPSSYTYFLLLATTFSHILFP
jgi:hypothetical protein